MKNRFSTLLESLLETAEVKNYVLANRLQYDVSYISKWVSGRMMPSPKTEEAVLRGISRCIVEDGSEHGRQVLRSDYQVQSDKDLMGAIFDHLMAECLYVRDAQRETGSTIAPKTSFFPRLNMPQYISKMHHPVLRRVKSLEIMALMDLMGMDREYRLQIASVNSGAAPEQWRYPDVHFSMIIDLSSPHLDYIYDTLFLLNMLTNMTRIDFQLYSARQAYGRAVFTVKDEFAISGMLMQSYECMAVTVSEDAENSGALYRAIRSLCSRERLLVRQISMEEMLLGNDYARSLISPNQRLMFGHMTEHFVDDELFEELLNQVAREHTGRLTRQQMTWFHTLAKRRFQELPIRITFYEPAFSEFAVNGEIDFYNLKVRLTPQQRLRYVAYIRDLVAGRENLEVKLVYGTLISDFQYNANQCVFLTDGISYLSLDDSMPRDSLRVVNHPDLKMMLERSFEKIWDDIALGDRDVVLDYVDHISQQIRLISLLDTRPEM